jgi:chromosome partitioning protein
MLAIVAPRPNRDGDEARAAIASEGLPIFAGSVRGAVAFSKASLAGSIVRDVSDRMAWTCWNDYAEIGREVLA